MTAWHWAQLALAAAALVEIVRTSRPVLLDAPCDASLLDTAIATAREAQPVLALEIARACEPAWAAQAWRVALEARAEGEDALQAIDVLHAQLIAGTADRLRQLAALGRVASPLAFLAIMLELANAFGSRHGLLALQRGLVERIGLERALFSFALGIATTGACIAVAAFLRSRLDRHAAELARIERSLRGA